MYWACLLPPAHGVRVNTVDTQARLWRLYVVIYPSEVVCTLLHVHHCCVSSKGFIVHGLHWVIKDRDRYIHLFLSSQ
jgi:hypothetical protein